jgi:hypothetical protein
LLIGVIGNGISMLFSDLLFEIKLEHAAKCYRHLADRKTLRELARNSYPNRAL